MCYIQWVKNLSICLVRFVKYRYLIRIVKYRVLIRECYEIEIELLAMIVVIVKYQNMICYVLSEKDLFIYLVRFVKY